jgi:hypothetical protein
MIAQIFSKAKKNVGNKKGGGFGIIVHIYDQMVKIYFCTWPLILD